jgi:hypothetical protein
MLCSISSPLLLICSSLHTLLTANFLLESALRKLHCHDSLAHDRIFYMVYKTSHIFSQLKFILSLLRLMPTQHSMSSRFSKLNLIPPTSPKKKNFLFGHIVPSSPAMMLQLLYLSCLGNLLLEPLFQLIW